MVKGYIITHFTNTTQYETNHLEFLKNTNSSAPKRSTEPKSQGHFFINFFFLKNRLLMVIQIGNQLRIKRYGLYSTPGSNYFNVWLLWFLHLKK